MTDVADVTEAVVTESTKGQDPSLPPPPEAQRGQTTVAPAVVERLAVKAAGEVPGVRAERVSTLRSWFGGASDAAGPPAVSGETELRGGHAEIRLTIGVEWPRSIVETAREVQRHVAAQVQHFSGVHVGRVDIEVTDLPTRPAPVRVQ